MTAARKPRNGPPPVRSAVRAGKVSVGDRKRGGQLSATLRDNDRGRRVFVNACEMSGVLVDVSVEDARAFALGLLELTDPHVSG